RTTTTRHPAPTSCTNKGTVFPRRNTTSDPQNSMPAGRHAISDFVNVGSYSIEEPLDLLPILPDHVIRADVPAALERLEFRAREFRELSSAFVRYVRVILGMKHQKLGTVDFVPVVPRIVEGATPKLAPVRI